MIGEVMVSEFTVFGSCTCRDIFNSTLNKDYKKYFRIGPTGIRLSFISIMQEPVKYSPDSLKLLPENKENELFSLWIKLDLDKRFLDELKKDKFEYMVMDTYYDVDFGIVDIGDNNYITNNVRLNQTEFFENLEHKRFMKINYDTENYFELWKRNCDLFFEFIKENCSNLKIILNPSRHVNKLLKEDGSIVYSKKFDEYCKRFNPYRDLLDEYIVENHDVDVLYFDESVCAPENHLWGPSSLHFEETYFDSMTDQLNSSIKRNDLLSDSDLSSLNEMFRKQSRNILLFKILSRKNNKSKFNSFKKIKLVRNYNNLLRFNSSISKQISQFKEDKKLNDEDFEFLLKLNQGILENQIKLLRKK